MGLRQYDFDTGYETSSQPAASDPVSPDDLLTLGYADDHYLNAESFNTTIANNQSSATSIASLTFLSTAYVAAKINYFLERKTASSNFQTMGEIYVFWDSADSAWRISSTANGDDFDVIGVQFSITTSTNTGQVKYTSTDISGATYSGVMKTFITRFAA